MTAPDPHQITLNQAIAMTTAYRNTFPGETRGWWFPRQVLESLLATPDMGGFRIYSGIAGGKVSPVLCPTNSSREDITTGYLAEVALPCPIYCDDDSALNG